MALIELVGIVVRIMTELASLMRLLMDTMTHRPDDGDHDGHMVMLTEALDNIIVVTAQVTASRATGSSRASSSTRRTTSAGAAAAALPVLAPGPIMVIPEVPAAAPGPIDDMDMARIVYVTEGNRDNKKGKYHWTSGCRSLSENRQTEIMGVALKDILDKTTAGDFDLCKTCKSKGKPPN
jgi:hypothetical protein